MRSPGRESSAGGLPYLIGKHNARGNVVPRARLETTNTKLATVLSNGCRSWMVPAHNRTAGLFIADARSASP
jgi:hypothetical protein